MVIDNGRNTIEIFTSGNSITESLVKYFKSLTLTDKRGIESDSFTMSLADPSGEVLEPDTFKILEFHVNGINKGSFEVNDITGGIHSNEFEVSGTAITTAGGLKVRRSRSFESSTIGDIIKTISSDNNFDYAIDDSLAAIKINQVDQIKESDLNLLTRIAADHGAIFKASHGRIVFTDKNKPESTTGVTLPVMAISDPTKTEGRWTIKRRDKVGTIKAAWFNDNDNKLNYETAGSEEPVNELPDQYVDKESAKLAADAALNDSASMDRGLSLTKPLDVKYVAGCNANITNHGLINGIWTIESMVHKIGVDGYDLTSMELKKPD